jgi:DNA polymerase III psi subunit
MITSQEKVLLEKILTAIRHSLNSVTIKYQKSLDLSVWSEKPSHLIYFGVPVNGVPLYDLVQANGVSIVASERLQNLGANEEARKKLWQVLKKQFSV